jgi:hypothetical protein
MMTRSFVLSAVCAAFVFTGASALAADKTKTAAKSTPHAATQPATESTVTENVSPTQLEIAARVLQGDAHCEFNQQVGVHAIEGKPGHFKVSFKSVSYTMVPQETTTGAVRLEDKKAGVVWIQIPAKSMMLNSKIGQRMVDGCATSQQRASL